MALTPQKVVAALGDTASSYVVALTRTGQSIQVNLNLNAPSAVSSGRKITDGEKCRLLLAAIEKLAAAGIQVDESNISLSQRRGTTFIPWPCLFVPVAARAETDDEALVRRVATDLMKGGLSAPEATARARELVAELRKTPATAAPESESETVEETASDDDIPV